MRRSTPMLTVWATAAIACLPLLAGCPAPSGTDPIDTDTAIDTVDPDSPVDTPTDTDTTDTDVFETGWLNEDTSPAVETDTPTVDTPDSGSTLPPDSATGGTDLPEDSSVCNFGEELDCNGLCFPAYFIGDGTCDDGSQFSANFDCATFSRDGGDCGGDTDTPGDTDTNPAPPDCTLTVRIFTGSWSSEIGWSIQEAGGGILFQRPTGFYNQNNINVTDRIPIITGDFVAELNDSFGDGWNGATMQIVDEAGRVLVDATIPTGRLARVPFSVECSTDTGYTPPPPPPVYGCNDISFTIVGGAANASQMGWEIRTATAPPQTLVSVGAGTVANGATVSNVRNLVDGWYIFRPTDSSSDGWDDGFYTIARADNGSVIASGTLPNGARGDYPFPVDCTAPYDIGLPALAGSVTCAPLLAKMKTGNAGGDVGFNLINESGVTVFGLPPGSYNSYGEFSVPVPPSVQSGVYTVEMIDAAGNGWEGASLSFVDQTSGYTLGAYGTSFTSGGSATDILPLRCPPLPPTPTGCPQGTTLGCDSVCWPTTYLGDGVCDDGTISNVDFFCASTQYDRGDCGPPP